MFLFVCFIIFALIALGLFLWSRTFRAPKRNQVATEQNEALPARGMSSRYDEPDSGRSSTYLAERRKWVGRVALATLAVSLLCLVFASFVIVSTKNIGIKTSFGATAGRFSNGLHIKWPWIKVHEMDGAVQTDSYYKGQCIDVRIANQQTGCVNVSIRWRIRPTAVDDLYQNYRSFDHVRDSLVTRELTVALNNRLSGYNPLNSIKVSTKSSGARPNPSLAVIATRVTKQMRDEIGTRIEVLNTLIPIIAFDSATQSRINQLQQQVAATRIAEQAQQTAVAQATANQTLAKSVNTSPNVLVAQCMDALTAMVKEKQSVPAGFSCWPGGAAAVIADATSGAKR